MKNTRSRSAVRPKVTNPLLANISAIPPGLIIAAVREASILPHARNAITRLALIKSKALGIPMPNVGTILSLYSGDSRRIEQAKALLGTRSSTSKQVEHEYEVCGSRVGFDWCGDEGLCVLLPHIEKAKGWVILEQEIAIPLTATVAEGMSRIRHAAQLAGARVMLFLVCPEGYEKSRLNLFCNEYLEVAPCDANTEFEIAFSIDCVGIREMNALGFGKTMCTIEVDEDGFHYRYEPFISGDLETRAMWVLRSRGKALEEIGRTLKKNKSSVLRRLRGLPTPGRLSIRTDWLEEYLESRLVIRGITKPHKGHEADDGGEAAKPYNSA